MAYHFIYEFSSLILLAFAISMDAFSVSLSYGLHKPRLKKIMKIGLLIGFFHMVFPLIGIVLGHVISAKLGYFTSVVSGTLLTGIGLHMFFSAFNSHVDKPPNKTKLTIISLAAGVSLDSFSIGLSLGMTGAKVVLTIILFGFVSLLMTWTGLLLGRKMSRYIGVYGEILGSSILVSFGLHILFS